MPKGIYIRTKEIKTKMKEIRNNWWNNPNNKEKIKERNKKISKSMKGITNNPFKKGHKTNLGRKCSKKTKTIKRKIMEEWWKENKNSKKVEERNKKIGFANKISHIGMKLSEEHKKNIGVGNSHPCLKKKIGQLKRWTDKKYREKQLNAIFKGLKLKPNKPEKFMIKLIEQNNLPFNYTGNGAIWFKGPNYSFNPDFLSKNPRHIIEVFGDYWHNLPGAKKKIKRD